MRLVMNFQFGLVGYLLVGAGLRMLPYSRMDKRGIVSGSRAATIPKPFAA